MNLILPYDCIKRIISYIPNDVITLKNLLEVNSILNQEVRDSLYGRIVGEKRLSKPQKGSLHLLIKTPYLIHFYSIIYKKCILCFINFQGAIKTCWGIPAHKSCIRRIEVNINLLKEEVDIEHLRKSIPCDCSNGNTLVLVNCNKMIVPYNWTLNWYKDMYYDEIMKYEIMIDRKRLKESIKRQNILKCRSRERAQKIKEENEEWRRDIEIISKHKNLPYRSYYSFLLKTPYYVRYKIKSLSSYDAIDIGHLAILTGRKGNIHYLAMNSPDIDEIKNRYKLILKYDKFIKDSILWYKLLEKYNTCEKINLYIESLLMMREDKHLIDQNFKIKDRVCSYLYCNNISQLYCCENRCGLHCCFSNCERHRCTINSLMLRKLVLNQNITFNN